MKKFLFSLAILTSFCVPILYSSQSAYALFEGSTQTACEGAALGGNNQCGSGGTQINDIIAWIINILCIIGGVIAVIMIIVGGFKFITSQGDSAQTTSARNTIIYAIVGLVIIALAQVIVQFVLNKL